MAREGYCEFWSCGLRERSRTGGGLGSYLQDCLVPSYATAIHIAIDSATYVIDDFDQEIVPYLVGGEMP